MVSPCPKGRHALYTTLKLHATLVCLRKGSLYAAHKMPTNISISISTTIAKDERGRKRTTDRHARREPLSLPLSINQFYSAQLGSGDLTRNRDYRIHPLQKTRMATDCHVDYILRTYPAVATARKTVVKTDNTKKGGALNIIPGCCFFWS